MLEKCFFILFFYFCSFRIPNHVDDDQDIHAQGDETGERGAAEEAAVGGTGHEVDVGETHDGAHYTHQGTAGDEARGNQCAAVIAGIVEFLVFAAAADEL